MNFAAQQSKIQRLIQTAVSATSAYRAVPYMLQASETFAARNNTQLNLVFNVPGSDDFYVERAQAFVWARERDPVSEAASETVFTPAVWTHSPSYYPWFSVVGTTVADPRYQRAVSANISLSDETNGAMQNAPFSAVGLYSALDKTAQSTQAGTPHHPGLVFDTPWFLRKGSSATMAVQVLFSQPKATAAACSEDYEYRISAVLTGHKRVRKVR